MRMFEVLDKLNQHDAEKGTAYVGVCNTVVEVKKTGANGEITIGVPGEVAEEISLSGMRLGKKSNKRVILLIVDGDAYDAFKLANEFTQP